MRLMRESRIDLMMVSAAKIVRRNGFISVTCASVANECTHAGIPTSCSLVKHYYVNREKLCAALAVYAERHGMRDIVTEAVRLGIKK